MMYSWQHMLHMYSIKRFLFYFVVVFHKISKFWYTIYWVNEQITKVLLHEEKNKWKESISESSSIHMLMYQWGMSWTYLCPSPGLGPESLIPPSVAASVNLCPSPGLGPDCFMPPRYNTSKNPPTPWSASSRGFFKTSKGRAWIAAKEFNTRMMMKKKDKQLDGVAMCGKKYILLKGYGIWVGRMVKGSSYLYWVCDRVTFKGSRGWMWKKLQGSF